MRDQHHEEQEAGAAARVQGGEWPGSGGGQGLAVLEGVDRLVFGAVILEDPRHVRQLADPPRDRG